MSTIAVPRNAIPFSSQEKNRPTSPALPNAKKFQEALAAATLEKEKAVPAAPNPASANSTYTIQQGDTLSEIVAAESKKLGINPSRHDLYTMVHQVAELNHLNNPNRIFPGQEINLTAISETQAEPVSGATSEAMTAINNVPDLPIDTDFQSPVNGKITSLFGMRNHPVLGETLHHNGIDISRPTGTPVKPLTAGIVTFSGDDGGYGLTVEVDHGNGLTSRYAHLSKLLVRQGEQVDPQQTIGQVGQTGLTTGPHLHLEIHRQNTPIDPLTLLNRRQVETSLVFAEAQKSQRM